MPERSNTVRPWSEGDDNRGYIIDTGPFLHVMVRTSFTFEEKQAVEEY